MNIMILCLCVFIQFQAGQVRFDNDLVHISVSFICAENLEEMSSISSKIKQIDAAGQIKEGNVDDLRIFGKEIGQLMLRDRKVKEEFIALHNKFKAALLAISKNQQDFIDKYKVLLDLEKKISNVIGEKNAISWLYKLAVFDIEGRLLRDHVSQVDIIAAIEYYEKKYGSNSLFLADLYWHLNRKLVRAGDFKGALDLYKKTKESAIKYTSTKSRRTYAIDIWAVKCYTEIGEYKIAQDIISSLDVNELLVVCEGMSYELYIFNSCASILSAKKNKIENAIIFQEVALVYLESFVDKADPNLATETNRLRDLFVRKGDRVAVRKLEDKYKLKPFPKKPGEE